MTGVLVEFYWRNLHEKVDYSNGSFGIISYLIDLVFPRVIIWPLAVCLAQYPIRR